ncbi:flavoprotein [Pectinatus haikarae]|uniref:Phosphopantothenoylcysteine synthetase/decarboxylase n=1 Tax=Pectinatus haikarae TaxID=349096 RepID=A0ABT9Y4L1_9FIRM|nr:flavoprotein [Pectinatus haikarae]MDQ0202661.1 phosphopantothenoylcysteine synthetase/decarboxylase [Pectinatus haikarae]
MLKQESSLTGKHILFAVSGGNAVWQSVETVTRLKQAGADVHVVMTASALKFLSPVSFQRASGNKVETDMWEKLTEMSSSHIPLSKLADIAIIAPATGNIISKLSCAIADDTLTTMLLACESPIFIAPCMNPVMYKNPIMQENILRLKKYDTHYKFIEPDEDKKKGKILPPQDIIDEIEKYCLTI